MHELALFAGAGGGILAGKLLGWRTVCAVERDLYAASILAQRQNDGHLSPFPVWSDISTFDGRPWRGRVDVVSGGFPCQDISSAGKGEGITGSRSGLWGEMARIVREVAPRFVFVENSPMLTSRGLGVVLRDLAALGFDAEWCVLGARDIGAPHKRDRIWILGYSNQDGQSTSALNDETPRMSKSLADADETILRSRRRFNKTASKACRRRSLGASRSRSNVERIIDTGENVSRDMATADERRRNTNDNKSTHIKTSKVKPRAETLRQEPNWWIEPEMDRVVDGVANRVDRLRALGNGQVPGVAALAFNILRQRLERG